MNAWPLSIKKMQDGKQLLILFDDNSEFSISAELLRVEGPSADIQGHGGPKIIVKNKSDVLVNKIEEVVLSQTILGRILGYGSISISGTGSGKIILTSIDNPLDFQKHLNNLRFNK